MVIESGSEDDDYLRFLKEIQHDEEEPMDPLYKVFLKHLRQDGKSYVFDMLNGDCGLPARVKYEEEGAFSGEMDVDARTSSCADSFDGRGNSIPKSSKKRGSCGKSDKVDELSPVPINKSESLPPDDDYMRFLSQVKLENENKLVLECGSYSITYEKESEAPVSPDSLVSDEQGLVPFKSKVIDLTVYEEKTDSAFDYYGSCEFKKKLMVILNKPYDQEEYEELWEKISERKPLERFKHLRNMSISYATNEEGSSYLDHYPDLAKQIWPADCHRRLILLRGFFFWLQNLCHEGAYMPWVSLGYETVTACDYEIIPPVPLQVARDEI